ncbi:MAG: ABC transporter ATP-binding protein [Alphaproteobacteria bacterium]|nr:ABC transporter ATP-binding protein [Alphaproteobacteria bacterium]
MENEKNNTPLLSVKDLKVNFNTLSGGGADGKAAGKIYALNGVNFDLYHEETLAIVGESGSGKSQTSLAIMGILAKNANVGGEINYHGKNLLTLSSSELNKIRGTSISMIFQDPMTSLNPYLRVSTQLTEVLTEKGVSEADARAKAIEILNSLSIPKAEKVIDNYPYQFSGGMRQRIMIAMSLMSDSEIIIADEPTTALDVTIQAQILDIINKLKTSMKKAIIFITHDLGVVSEIADKIAVFYAGEIVEVGTRDEIFNSPKHPYTIGLLKSIPRLDQDSREKLFLIEGNPPLLKSEPASCSFKDRCNSAMAICRESKPTRQEISKTHAFSCFRYDNKESGYE